MMKYKTFKKKLEIGAVSFEITVSLSETSRNYSIILSGETIATHQFNGEYLHQNDLSKHIDQVEKIAHAFAESALGWPDATILLLNQGFKS